MADKQETGTALMFIGLAILVADLLVVFFLPSGYKVGRQSTFLAIIIVLALLGLIFLLTGYRKRGRAED